MASAEVLQAMMRASPVVAPPIPGTAAKRVNTLEHASSRHLFLDSNCKETGAKSPHLQPPPQQLQGRLRQQRRTPTTPRCPSHPIIERKGKEWASLDVCRKLFGEVSIEVEQGPPGQKKQAWSSQGASLDTASLSEEGLERIDTVKERSRGHKSQEKSVDSRARLVRQVSEERLTAKLQTQTAIKELRARIDVSVHDAMEAAEARLATQFLNAIVPSYDDLRQRVGAMESRILGVTNSPSARAHEGRESQLAECLLSAWPERLGERIVALEERSDSISALEQAVADLRLPLVSLESKRDRLESMCEALRIRIAALELHCAKVICGRPVSDVQEAINSSERRLMDELQVVRAENRERVQVLSSQLLEVRVAALQAQALQDEPFVWQSKAADSTLQPTDPVS